MTKVVLIRHGQTTFNKKGLFCGWVDAGLTARGRQEAIKAGKDLKRRGFVFDVAFDSYLRRSSQTLSLILKSYPGKRPKIVKDWRLNERHYGDLQGKNKKESVKEFGLEQVMLWRRSYSVRPPKISASNRFDQRDDAKYSGLPVPRTESLQDVEKRVVAFWRDMVIPVLKEDKRVIISASGNSLRALVKHLSKLSAKEVVDFNIPTGIPLVYELSKKFKAEKRYFLASARDLARAVEEVKGQVKVK
ncbi:MAG: 2,3-bisphosphoglycerate-dependent phosphoglycerate mutase [Patescibacteria group bacterium]